MDTSLSAQVLKELCQTEAVLNQQQIECLAEKIRSHDRIFVYGGGRTGLMLKAFAMRLMQMGKTPFVIGETITPSIQAGDLLVTASASGSTKSVCDYVQSAIDGGVAVAAIVGCSDSPLEKLVAPDVIIHAGNKYTESGLQPMGSLFEQMLLIVLDAIVLSLSSDTQQRAAMQQRHANME